MKEKLQAIIILLIYNFFFFLILFFPTSNTIVTPETGGGDTLVVQLPYKKVLCENINNFSLPFWSKNISFGYPLLAEGEIASFNPINIVTCLLFDYKTSFNVQLVLHTFIAQLGLIFLGSVLGLSIFSRVYLAVLFPVSPLILMNYMQVSLVYPFFLVPYILGCLIRICKKQSYINWLLLSTAIFFQYLVHHSQIFFISFVFCLVFLLTYILYRVPNMLKKINLLLIFVSTYIIGLLAAGFQLLPNLEFFINSDRSSSIYGSFASRFDQNLSIRNFLTLFNPFMFGDVKDGTFPYSKAALPWEGTFFIYYIPLIFLLLFFYYLKKIRNKYTLMFMYSLLIILLLALGKNSPLSFVHSLPFFSAFRFPTRFVFVLIFILTILSSFGFDFLIKKIRKIKYKVFVLLLTIIIIFFESYLFFRSFHILKPSKMVFKDSKFVSLIRDKDTNSRIYIPNIDISLFDKKYMKNGYKDNYAYDNHVVDLMFANTNVIFDLNSVDNKAGPQLKRLPYFLSNIIDFESLEVDKKIASFSASAKTKLFFSGTEYVLSSFKFNNDDFLDLYATIPQYSANIYKMKQISKKINFYSKSLLAESIKEIDEYLSLKNIQDKVILEDKNLVNNLSQSDSLKGFYKLFSDTDQYMKAFTNTNENSLLVVSDIYYPGWKAYIDGVESKIYRANFLFRGILLPKGGHIVEFKYEPRSFYLGAKISMISSIVLIIVSAIVFLRRRLHFS